MKDDIDKAVEYLTAHPDEIRSAWSKPPSHIAGCLFANATPDGGEGYDAEGYPCGCLTQVRDGWFTAYTPELTAAIRADERIPTDPRDITVDSLPVFAEWQRRIRRELAAAVNS